MKSCILFLALLGFSFQSTAQWKRVFIPTFQDLYDIQVTGNIGYAVGHNGSVLKSSDTGKSWKNLALTIPANLRALYFLDSNIGLVIGENARIQKTVDGGKNWSQKYIRTAAYGYDIVFQDNNGLAVGKDMLAISSVDYGENWSVDTTFNSYKKLNSVTIMPNGNCWAVGDSGFILSKKITSEKWKVTKFPTKVDLNHVSHIGNHTLIITGGMPDSAIVGKYYNILMMSVDSGNTWSQTAVAEMKIINSASYLNTDTGFLVGSSGIISRCNDGIEDRSLQLTGISSGLNQITFSNGVGLVVGDGGTMLRTTNFGGFRLGVKVPELLRQKPVCIPNPGNGRFVIKSESEIRELSIYNSEGKLISHFTKFPDGQSFVLELPGVYNIVMLDESGFYSSVKLVVNAY